MNSVSAPTENDFYYKDVDCTKDHYESITFIITNLATQSLPGLLSLKTDLDVHKERIKGVHTLKFLEVIFLDSTLSSHMEALYRRQSIPWGKLIGNIHRRMEKLILKKNAEEHVESFCKAVKVDPSEVKPLIQTTNKGRWERLVLYLIEKKSSATEVKQSEG